MIFEFKNIIIAVVDINYYRFDVLLLLILLDANLNIIQFVGVIHFHIDAVIGVFDLLFDIIGLFHLPIFFTIFRTCLTSINIKVIFHLFEAFSLLPDLAVNIIKLFIDIVIDMGSPF